MTAANVYLKQNVLAEPLVNQWYAWSYLISPATAAMYMANQHMKVMNSFIANPQIHINALKNPAMIGGPFINYDAGRVGEIKLLIEKTTRERPQMLEFAQAVKKLDQILASEAKGHSLEPLYEKTPDALRGYVELVYDLNNNASIRFIEGLLYRSRYYNPASQSFALSLVEKDGRHFVFSTPRLKDDTCLHLNMPFDSEALDDLFAMKDRPQPYGVIREKLGVTDEADELFSSFFTEEAPKAGDGYDGDGVRVRYFGHACVLIETAETSILVDPLISYEYPSEVGRYTYADLPREIDYVVMTHNHQDHCMLETLLQLRHKIKTVIVPRSNAGALADPSFKLMLQNIGFKNVREIEEMESIPVPGGQIVGLPFPGEHADLNIRTKTAYYISLKGRSALCVADSNNIEPRLYEHIHEIVGDVDILFIGMECVGGPLTWLYGPLLTQTLPRGMDQSRRFDGSDYRKAMNIVDRLGAKQVYVYAMGAEPWLTYLTSIEYTKESRQIVESDKLIEECKRRGIRSERLFGQKEILL